jgi:phage shock protein C
MIFGVCKGLANYLDANVTIVRLGALLCLFFTGFVVSPMIVVYTVAAILMRPEPVVPFETEADREFYDSYTSSRTMAIHRLKRTYESLDRRIQRIESIVTARDFSWDSRLKE